MMKTKLFGLMLFLGVNSYAGCNGATGTFIQGNIGSVDVKGVCDGMVESSCSMNWDDDFYTLNASLKIGNMTMPLVTIQSFFGSGYTTFSKDAMVNWIYSNNSPASYYGGPSNYLIKDYAGTQENWTLTITVTLQNFWNQFGEQYVQTHIIKNPYGISYNNAYCSGTDLTFNDLVWNIPSNHTGQYVTFGNGDSWNGNVVQLTQSVNGLYSFTYYANVAGYLSRRPISTTVAELKEAYFVDVPQSSGTVTQQSPSSPMANYVFSNGGTLEYLGNGLIQNGNNWWFDPSTACTCSNYMQVRTNNNGCYSQWDDTVFIVTPIVQSFNAPMWKVESTFPGEYGSWAFTNNAGGSPLYVGKFHWGCSDKTYNFTASNFQPGLTLEYKVIWHNSIVQSGTTTNYFSYTTDLSENILINQETSVYPIDSIAINNNTPFNLLTFPFGTGYDITGDGNYNSDDYIWSKWLGDVIEIKGRFVNAVNDVSDWTSFYVGIAPSPVVDKSNALCFSGDPVMSPVTETPLYVDGMDYDAYRSVLWDVDMDWIFELDGSVDNYLLPLATQQKAVTMRQAIVDSVLMYGYNVATDSFFNVWLDGTSTVCYSNIDTTYVVRLPEFTTNFSVVDTISIGTPIQHSVSGQWFNVNTDTIRWNWSDGSPEYYGNNVWHYYNDLGWYTLNLEIEDSYGCVSDSIFYDYWFVPGVLNLDEVFEEIELTLYPVPVVNKLTIETELGVESVEVFNMMGELVAETNEKVLLMDGLPDGTYVVKVITDKGVIDRKIVKL